MFLLFETFSFVNSRGAVEASQINCLHPIRCKPTKNGAIIVSLVSRVYTPRIPTTGALQRFREAAASKAFVGQIVNLRPIGNRPAESEHAFTALRRRRIVGRPAAETDDRRAIASRPRILLFDEATSALDNQTQAIVSRSLEALDAARIVIAHRLSTIVKADRIFVLEAGRVVQSGTYAELIATGGFLPHSYSLKQP